MRKDHFKGDTVKRVFVFIINHQMPLFPVWNLLPYFNLIAKSKIVLTRKDLKNMIAKKTIIGDISIPKERGSIFLIGYNIGSVDLYKNCTIGLYGSGLTQLIKALINTNQ